MKHYNVSASVGMLVTTVDAENEDAAIAAAITKWEDEARAIIATSTFEAREHVTFDMAGESLPPGQRIVADDGA